MRGWILPIFLVASAVLIFLTAVPPLDWSGYGALSGLLLVALLIAPPLWRVRAAQGPFVRGVWLTFVLILASVVLVLPVKTHAVKLEMPKPGADLNH